MPFHKSFTAESLRTQRLDHPFYPAGRVGRIKGIFSASGRDGENVWLKAEAFALAGPHRQSKKSLLCALCAFAVKTAFVRVFLNNSS
jgi:hypothetical protein